MVGSLRTAIAGRAGMAALGDAVAATGPAAAVAVPVPVPVAVATCDVLYAAVQRKGTRPSKGSRVCEGRAEREATLDVVE